ncbi:MAG: FAD-dependent oxidoreductase [Marinilabiliales bacterium]|nr:FAD-dependent oxidoreductase [Marinilabiliales bacterium]
MPCSRRKGEWLGGMLTSAGVSAVDNNNLPGGIWGEFRGSLYFITRRRFLSEDRIG